MLSQLCAAWLEAKEAERKATESRRQAEDALTQALNIAETFEGIYTAPIDGHTVKITGRMSRKIDAEKAQEIAAEYGLSEHLTQLFRWKAELNMAAWRAADESITAPLLGAITTTPGRPSFQITITTEKDN